MYTLADLIKHNTPTRFSEVVDLEVSNHPEANVLPAENLADGEFSYETLVATGLPSVAFTKPGEGVAPSKSTYELRKTTCYDLEGRIKAPVNSVRRLKGGIERLLALEEIRHFRAMLKQMGYALYYGQTKQAEAPANAFPGLLNLITADMTVDATGAAAKSSVYALRTGPIDISMVLGGGLGLDFKGGTDNYRVESVVGADGKEYDAYVGALFLSPGLQALAEHAAARLKNIGTAENKTLTSTMVADLLDKAPTGQPFNQLFMSKRSRRQLWNDIKSLPGVSAVPEELKDFWGVPITVTDSISNAETV